MGQPNSVVTVLGNVQEIFENQVGDATNVRFDVEDSWKNDEGAYDKVTYSVTLWRKRGEVFKKFFKKGSGVVITGKISGIYEKPKKDDSGVWQKITLEECDFKFPPRDRDYSARSGGGSSNHDDTEDLNFG